MDPRDKPEDDTSKWTANESSYFNASFAFFIRSASTYTRPPMARNLALTCAVPSPDGEQHLLLIPRLLAAIALTPRDKLTARSIPADEVSAGSDIG
jgi:hypothetical protein